MVVDIITFGKSGKERGVMNSNLESLRLSWKISLIPLVFSFLFFLSIDGGESDAFAVVGTIFFGGVGCLFLNRPPKFLKKESENLVFFVYLFRPMKVPTYLVEDLNLSKSVSLVDGFCINTDVRLVLNRGFEMKEYHKKSSMISDLVEYDDGSVKSFKYHAPFACSTFASG